MVDEFVYRGKLEDTALPEILETVHRHGVPGVMEFARQDEEKQVYFLDGDVIFAASSNRDESLGEFLLNAGRITKVEYDVSTLALNRSPGRRHGSVLVEMGFIGAEELGSVVREQVQSILWSLFNWDGGEVAFRVGRFCDDEVYKIKIPTPRVILAGCKRMTDAKKVTSKLGGRHVVLHRNERPDHLVSLRLEVAEQELLELIDGKQNLLELCENGPMTPGLNARVLYAFQVLGLVDREANKGIRIKVAD